MTAARMAWQLCPDELNWRLKLFEEEIHCNTALENQAGKKVKCHWHILCEFSEYFQNMYQHNFIETQPGNTIKVNIDESTDIPEDLLQKIVIFLYTRTIDLNEHDCFIVFRFAHLYRITHLLQIAESYFMNSLDFTRQPSTVLDCIHLYLSDEQYKEVESVVVKKLASKHCSHWMKSPSFLFLSSASVISLLSRPTLQCRDETQIFEAIIVWWKYKESVRDTDVTEVLKKALIVTELTVTLVLNIIKAYNLQPTHPLEEFATSLPVYSLDPLCLQSSRTNYAGIVNCFVLHLCQIGMKNKFFRLLMEIDADKNIYRYKKLEILEDTNDVTEAGGITFIQTLPSLHYQQLENPDFQRLEADLLFGIITSTKVQAVLSVKFEDSGSTKKLQLTVCKPNDFSYEEIRRGELSIPKATFPEDEHILHVHKELLFATHCSQRSVVVYDLKVMKVIGKVFITTTDSWFVAAAQLLNVIVFVGMNENYLYDLDAIASSAKDGHASSSTEAMPPLAKFQQPVKINSQTKFSAEINGCCLYLVMIEMKHLSIFSHSLESISENDAAEQSKWYKQDVPLPYDDVSEEQLHWIDLQRHKSKQQNWKNFAYVEPQFMEIIH